MESAMLKMVKTKCPDKKLPTAFGKKWNFIEDKNLLDELTLNLSKERIAKNHNRTIGGIEARIRVIAYTMYTNNTQIDEIINKTKLTKEQIMEAAQKENNKIERRKLWKIKSENIPVINNFENMVDIKEQLMSMEFTNDNIDNIIEQLTKLKNLVNKPDKTVEIEDEITTDISDNINISGNIGCLPKLININLDDEITSAIPDD